MSNKGKIIKNISIISVLFLVFIAMFNITSNAASTTLTQKNLQDMVKSDKWYTFDPTKYIGKPVVDRNAIGAGDEKYGYCIDSAHAKGGNYRIVNIIDINNMVEKEGQAKVYGVQSKTFKQGQKYTISQHPNLKPYIMTAYLASIPKETDGSLWNNYTTIQEIFYNKFYVNKMKHVGLYPDFQATNNNSESEMLRYNRILQKASKYADNYMKASSTSGYMEDNMTDKQKEKVEFKVIGSKTYIGPYKINLKGDCKVERITVNGIGAKKIVIASSMDGIEKKPEKDVNKTPDNKYFYIVVNAKLNKIDSVVLKGTKSKKILKGRLMVLAGGNAQDWIFYKAEESETPSELSLYCPEKHVGSIEITKKDELNANLNFKDVGFKLYNVDKGWVAEDGNGNKKYVAHFDDAKEYKTGDNGKVTIKNVDAGKYKIFETSIPKELEKYYKIGTWNVPIFGTDKREKRTAVAIKNSEGTYVHKVTDGTTVKVTRINLRAYSALQIQKVDTQNSNAKLTGIKFRIYKLGPDAGWVTVKSNYQTSSSSVLEYTGIAPDSEYDTNKNIAELITFNNVTPTIEQLPLGTYQVYEISVGPYSNKYSLGEFTVDGGETYHKGDRKGEVPVGVNKKGFVVYTAKNTPVPHNISISGKVWLDSLKGKNTQERNAQYDEGEDLLSGITVQLVDKTTGQVVKTTTTDAKGAYRFDNVDQAKLADYIVRFVYNGYTYEDVISDYSQVQDKENTSKAVEDNTRKTLNDLFTDLTGEGQKLSNGVALNYNKSADRVNLTDETINKLPKVQANTADGYIKKCYDKDTSVEEIKNIDLGLYEREMPNLTIQKDIDSADVSLNGYTYTYHYNKKLTGDAATETQIGVDFDGDYALPVYNADVKYNKDNAGKALEASVMYKIKLQNAHTTLYSEVKEIREAFSSNYQIVPGEIYLSESAKFDGTARKVNATVGEDRDSNADYSDRIITFAEPIKLDAAMDSAGKNTKYVYIRLKILDIDKEYELYAEGRKPDESQSNLKNIVEISKYTTYADKNYNNKYAGVDKTSIPNNLNVYNYDPNEDDNDKAPGIRIVDAGTRSLSGTVFVDEDADGITGAKQERIGNGKLDDNEAKLEGITVKLVDQNGNTQSEAKTDKDGNFTISGFIPGKYKLVYTWGDENHNVVDYKATIYNIQAADNWITTKNAEKYSIAMDNYTTRQAIDKNALKLSDDKYSAEELTAIGSVKELNKMDSATKEFTIGIEATPSDEALGIGGNFEKAKFVFTADNANFGIIERPRQALDIDKKVTSILVTTEQGQTVADAKIVNGKLEVKTGEKFISGGEDLGYIWLQIDKSITQAMTAKIGYTITVSNNSEQDYADENYYNYGIKSNNAVQMTLKADAVYDYMKGENLSSEEGLWKTVSLSEYENNLGKYEDKQTITERSFISQANTFEKDENNKIKSIGSWQTNINKMQSIYTDWVDKLDTLDTTTVRSVKLAERDIAQFSEKDNKLTKAMQPGDSESVEILTSKLISNGDDIRFDNDAEIADITFETTQKTGRKPSALTSKTYDRAGWVSITPATGEDKDYTWIIVTAVSAIAVLGVGIIFIKKKILK